MEPKIPKNLDPLALEILGHVCQISGSQYIVLGGYFALKHYIDYRETKDIDAWWAQGLWEATQREVFKAIQDSLASLISNRGLSLKESDLSLKERKARNMQSLEICANNKTIFSFQIANRDTQLENPLPSPYTPILIETLADNLASKMCALVQRGAPRDFRDIYMAVTTGTTTSERLWELLSLKYFDLSPMEAKKMILLRLTSIEQRRPLISLSEEEKVLAHQLRLWYKNEFLCMPKTSNGL